MRRQFRRFLQLASCNRRGAPLTSCPDDPARRGPDGVLPIRPSPLLPQYPHPDRVWNRDFLHAKNDVDESTQLSVGHWLLLLLLLLLRRLPAAGALSGIIRNRSRRCALRWRSLLGLAVDPTVVSPAAISGNVGCRKTLVFRHPNEFAQKRGSTPSRNERKTLSERCSSIRIPFGARQE